MENSIDDILKDVSGPSIELDIPVSSSKDIFAVHRRQAWDKTVEARCDFTYNLRITKRSDVHFISIWKKSVYGRTLTDIKSDPGMVDFFVDNITPVIADTLGHFLGSGHWCICTSPKRRHKAKNFATMISERIAEALSIPFYEDVAFCHSRHRMNAEFTLNVLPKEPNVIVFDDFVTTGQTLASMKRLLTTYGKNLVFFAGINNKL
jgi:phosphoribosylpyrophosphate synthetase